MSTPVHISVMHAVPDAPAAAWYREALRARQLWNMGAVIGLEVEGAPFFLAQPAGNGWTDPAAAGRAAHGPPYR